MKEYKTNDFFKMAFIRMKTGKAPDDVEVYAGLQLNGRPQGIAVYNDDTEIKNCLAEMTAFVESFKMPFQEMKNLIMKKVKEEGKIK